MADFTGDFVVEDVDDVASADIHIHGKSVEVRRNEPKQFTTAEQGGDVEILDAHKLAQRQKQIDFGKNTIGYQRYLQHVPMHMRKKGGPTTPDIKQDISKRCFDGQVKAWRRLLHEFDTMDPPAEAPTTMLGADDGCMVEDTEQQGPVSGTPGAVRQQHNADGCTPGSTRGMNSRGMGGTPRERSDRPCSPMGDRARRHDNSSGTPNTGRQVTPRGEQRQGRQSGAGRATPPSGQQQRQHTPGGYDKRSPGAFHRQQGAVQGHCDRRSGGLQQRGSGNTPQHGGRQSGSRQTPQSTHGGRDNMPGQRRQQQHSRAGAEAAGPLAAPLSGGQAAEDCTEMGSPDSKGSLDGYLGPNYKPQSRKRQHDVTAGINQDGVTGAEVMAADADAPQPKRSVTTRSMEISLLGMVTGPNQASTAASGPQLAAAAANAPTSFAGLGLASRLQQQQPLGAAPAATAPTGAAPMAVDGAVQASAAVRGSTETGAVAALKAKIADEDNILREILGDSRWEWADDEDSNTARMCT